MGKTKRKEKSYKDYPSYDLDEFISDAYEDKRNKRKKNRQSIPSPQEEYDQDEDYGSFEKMSKRT